MQVKLLRSDSGDTDSAHFGHDVIPSALKTGLKVVAHHFDGYWRVSVVYTHFLQCVKTRLCSACLAALIPQSLSDDWTSAVAGRASVLGYHLLQCTHNRQSTGASITSGNYLYTFAYICCVSLLPANILADQPSMCHMLGLPLHTGSAYSLFSCVLNQPRFKILIKSVSNSI